MDVNCNRISNLHRTQVHVNDALKLLEINNGATKKKFNFTFYICTNLEGMRVPSKSQQKWWKWPPGRASTHWTTTPPPV